MNMELNDLILTLLATGGDTFIKEGAKDVYNKTIGQLRDLLMRRLAGHIPDKSKRIELLKPEDEKQKEDLRKALKELEVKSEDDEVVKLVRELERMLPKGGNGGDTFITKGGSGKGSITIGQQNNYGSK